MRTQHPVPGDGTATGTCFPGRGLCCPEDPLDLVLQLFPTDDRAPPPPPSLAALGIGVGPGAGGEPTVRRVIKQEPQSPPPLAQSAFDVGGLQDSWGFLLEGLWTGLDETEDVDMFFADDDALDGGGSSEATTQGNLLLCDPTTGAKPEPPAHMPAAGGGGPVHVRTRGSLGGAVVVPNDASPMPADAFPLRPYDACRAFDGAVFSSASTPAPATTAPSAGGPPPVFVANNSTPQLPALIMPAAAPAPSMPLPAAASLHACGALPGIVSNMAPAPPPPLMALMPARALHPNATAVSGVYSISSKAPAAHATPSSSPPSRTSFGSGRSPSSATSSSETEFLQPHHVWVVPRKLRSPPSANRRKRPWLLDFPLHALPPVVALPPQANPTGDDNDGDDAKNRNAMVLVSLVPPGNTTGGDDDDIAADSGGGIRRRRRAPRQRNRQAQRVCSHCRSPETPQWRAGPDGPGTLCNACGIRYAANRLLPEYRPSTAPSFRSGQHSNRHRKVMKLREQVKAATAEEKPSSEQRQPMEDDRSTKEEEEDGSIMGVFEYISAAGL